MIKVGFFADIRAMVGMKELIIDDTPPTLSALMNVLCLRFGKDFTERCMDGNIISCRVNILINGIHMLHIDKDLSALKDGDDVRIFPVIGGG